MYGIFKDPKVQAFAKEFPNVVEPARKEFYRRLSERRVEGKFQEFLSQHEDRFRREVAQLSDERAVKFSEKHAAKMPELVLRYEQEMLSGHIRLSFEHYLLNILIPEFDFKERARVS